ncbi:MAG: flagellar basal-body rod protein FlgC [Gammaproteobacteria bacterium]|nr:MAG: flagellar basal-body rod protein FlgC [Gammaproteobacteria bacterium]
MGLMNVFAIAGSGLVAQTVRMNTVASNLANAGVEAGSAETAYRARHPVFQAVYDRALGGVAAVRVAGIVESTAEPPRRYRPDHPLADAEGYVYESNVNIVEEMTDLLSASRSYQGGVELLDTAKDLMLATLRLGEN